MGRGAATEPLGAVTRVALAAAAVALAAALGVLLLARGSTPPAIAPVTPVAVHASFDPAVVQFGDPLTARVVVLLDRDAVRPQTLRIADDLAPLTQLAAPATARTVHGRLETLTITARAACLTEACIAGPVRLPHVHVSVAGPGGRVEHVSTAWAPLPVRSRVTAADLAAASPRFAADTAPGAPTYRVAPATAATLLDVLAVAAAVGAVALVAFQALALVRRRRPVARDELARALRLAREAEERPVPDRRRALGLLARLLGGAQGTSASDLAWSQRQPDREALRELVTRVERERTS